jgi:hypothetical protein
MALDTYQECWNRVILRCPNIGPKLAQDMVTNAFRRLAEVRRWSWLVKFGQFIAPVPTTTGTITVTQNSTIVTGSGTSWGNDLVGQQLRIGLTNPIYTVSSVDSTTQLELDYPWGGTTASAQTYSIYQAFYTPPNDFHQLICLWDPAFNWQLYLDVQQSEINIWDAQRGNIGNSYVVSFRDYTTSQVGTLSQPVQVNGSGAIPSTTGSFTAPSNAIYTVQITTTGTPGTAVYKWSKNNGSYTTNVLTDAGGAAQSLMDGINIVFPLGSSYTNGDIFVISGTAIANAGLPRYELWPHQQANHVYPFLYESRPVDLDDPNAVLPRYIRGDVLVDMAMEEICSWPGPSQDKPNIYYSMMNAERYARNNAKQIQLLEVQDDNVWQQDLTYQYPAMAWAMATPLGDARFLQSTLYNISGTMTGRRRLWEIS